MITSCDLSKAEIFKTSLDGMDLSSCKLRDVAADLVSVKGVSVDMTGAINLSTVLGINIKF